MSEINPIAHWSEEGRWPKEYFIEDDQTRKDLKTNNTMVGLLAKPKSPSELRSSIAPSESSLPTASEEMSKELKSILYDRQSYEDALAENGSYIGNFDMGITDASKKICQNLLEAEQLCPQDTIFRNDLFERTCKELQMGNEIMVIRSISSLICPPATVLRIDGAEHLFKVLNESFDQGWNCAVPFYDARPQPDYSVGFRRSAFTDNQLKKLAPFVGEIPDTCTSYFMATWRMYFPFLTCEVKCATTFLEVADRQNAHSMTLAVRGVVDLFRTVGREKELHREILAFSISHNHETVRIYGHYPVIDGAKTTFYRYTIKEFNIRSEEGKDKWTSYRFVRNVYDVWMPTHLARICSVIDELPLDPKELKVLLESVDAKWASPQGLES